MKEKRIQIVCVDDDSSILRLVSKTLLAAFGDLAGITTFTSSIETIEYTEKTPIDIILSDLDLPEMNGLELLKSIRGRNPFTKFIMLTGKSSKRSLLDALALGADDYLLKPVVPDELIAVMRETIARQLRWEQALVGTLRSARKFEIVH